MPYRERSRVLRPIIEATARGVPQLMCLGQGPVFAEHREGAKGLIFPFGGGAAYTL